MVEGLQAEVVQDEQGCFFDLIEGSDIGSVEFGGGNFFNKAVHVEVKGFVAHLTGMSAEGASEERFSAAGGAGDNNILGLPDEVAGSQECDLIG